MPMLMPLTMDPSLLVSIFVDLKPKTRGKEAQHVDLPVAEGSTDSSATKLDSTSMAEDGSYLFKF